uniref:Thioesterase domain-containing protein n=1 Tax=Moniliophthora roreri TaxID=221103 RepID=A0A0W0F415_MONRR
MSIRSGFLISVPIRTRYLTGRPARQITTSCPRLNTTTTTPPTPNHIRRNTFLAATLITAVSAYVIGSFFPPPPVSLLFPRPAPAPPSDVNSPECQTYLAELEKEMLSLPLLEQMRNAPDAREWYEVPLRGPGKLALPPVVRARWDEKESVIVLHVGRGLCGHDGIIHGGLLATLLDETLARTAINNLPERIGVTAKLTLNYRAPTKADQFIVIRTELVGAKGRKADVKGRVEDLNGTLLVEATATFIQPRYAKLLNKAAIRQVMGAPSEEHAPVHLADGENFKSLKTQDGTHTHLGDGEGKEK